MYDSPECPNGLDKETTCITREQDIRRKRIGACKPYVQFQSLQGNIICWNWRAFDRYLLKTMRRLGDTTRDISGKTSK